MAYIPAPNAMRICLQFVWTSQTVEICFGLLKSSAPILSDLVASVVGLETWRVAELNPNVSSDLVATLWNGTILTTQTSPTYQQAVTTNAAGTGSAGTVPNNVTCVTTYQTDLRGRSYRGRVYTPGLPTAALVSPTEIDPANAALLTLAYAAVNSYLPVGITHCVLSYQNNNVMRSTAARTPVTGYRTEVRLDSQRRRLEGRGL